ncbi:MAG: hypothetical protein ACFFBE_05505 [Promethearchaeota archaeon]
MGRKFGEELNFVSTRVPKSKRKEYREAIKNFVENRLTMGNAVIYISCFYLVIL